MSHIRKIVQIRKLIKRVTHVPILRRFRYKYMREYTSRPSLVSITQQIKTNYHLEAIEIRAPNLSQHAYWSWPHICSISKSPRINLNSM